ncbi:hypothetical protein [Segniliparus rugosus]|uniref:Minor tail protein n=1 Tax=Segniliparus rugosus (strain ATCC BAA-974 / DSM 45345 / CCUG 50838 / CIP 108380 / JCM 13579 / CDC 945) TaxID=679197 RepID=E5XRR9_SEGRC|nr:hypothetical protein [Segniliparus rugosus]EFV12934.1 hypothetical protein HMPREF9336_02191 [Segniliparus rugosus ATCC BAA-974]
MTTPNQPFPDLSSVLGLGAYQIGGGSKNYGQDVTEEFVKSLFTVPDFNLGNSVQVLVQELRKLPLELLKLFSPLIPDATEEQFKDVLTAVDTIVGLLVDRKPPLDFEDFQKWVSESFTTIETEVRQILEILGGLVVTPINAAVQAVKDWWNALTGRTQNLNTDGTIGQGHVVGLGEALQNLGEEAQEHVASLVDAVQKGAQGVVDTFEGAVQGANKFLADLFQVALSAFNIGLTSQTQLQDITNDQQLPDGQPGTVWSTTFTGADNSTLPSGDWAQSDDLVIKANQVAVADGVPDSSSAHHWALTAQSFLTLGQSASAVLGSSVGSTSAMRTGLYLNANSDFTSAAYCHVTTSNIYVGRMARSGSSITLTQLTSVSASIKSGDMVRFRYYNGTYHVVVNGVVKIQHTDTGNIIPTGAGYNRAAISLQRVPALDWVNDWVNDSFRIASFAMSDWMPLGANVTTPAWRLRRSSGSAVSLSVAHGATAAMPNGFYTSKDLESGVTVTTLGTGTVTINEDGWYEISASSINNDSLNATPSTVGGTMDAGSHGSGWRASMWVLHIDGVASVGPVMAGVPVTVYLAAGQVVAPGVSASWPLTGAGSFSNKDINYSQAYNTRSSISSLSGAPAAAFIGRKVG